MIMVGVLGWGVGGIEAEAVMLWFNLLVYLSRQVVGGVKLVAAYRGLTATDLVLTVPEMLA